MTQKNNYCDIQANCKLLYQSCRQYEAVVKQNKNLQAELRAVKSDLEIELAFNKELQNKLQDTETKALAQCKNAENRISDLEERIMNHSKEIEEYCSRLAEKQKECEDYTTKFRNSRLPGGLFEGLLPAIIDILQYLSISIVIWACVNHWFGINMDVGLIYVFITYIKQLFEPITRIIDNVETIQEAVVSIDKIFDILDQKESLEDFESGKEITEIKGKIEFRNVWFAYEGENWILKNVSFTINPGESIALVGKTGSGKTTITNLLNRFYEIQRGEILIDDINIKDINLRSLREKIGIVLQEPFIFSRSIKDNIKLNDNIDDQAVEQAVKLACADEFVESLPNGLEQISREKGNSYSAGQKQLLAFARIFAHNPSIFILDEATANIDTQTEKSIQKAIDRISKDKTSIFIAHRLSTIVNVDKIIVLDHGEIIEQGNHHQLVNSGGYYSKLYNSYYESLG